MNSHDIWYERWYYRNDIKESNSVTAVYISSNILLF